MSNHKKNGPSARSCGSTKPSTIEDETKKSQKRKQSSKMGCQQNLDHDPVFDEQNMTLGAKYVNLGAYNTVAAQDKIPGIQHDDFVDDSVHSGDSADYDANQYYATDEEYDKIDLKSSSASIGEQKLKATRISDKAKHGAASKPFSTKMNDAFEDSSLSNDNYAQDFAKDVISRSSDSVLPSVKLESLKNSKNGKSLEHVCSCSKNGSRDRKTKSSSVQKSFEQEMSKKSGLEVSKRGPKGSGHLGSVSRGSGHLSSGPKGSGHLGSVSKGSGGPQASSLTDGSPRESILKGSGMSSLVEGSLKETSLKEFGLRGSLKEAIMDSKLPKSALKECSSQTCLKGSINKQKPSSIYGSKVGSPVSSNEFARKINKEIIVECDESSISRSEGVGSAHSPDYEASFEDESSESTRPSKFNKGRQSSINSSYGRQSSIESPHGRQSSTESPHGRQSFHKSSSGRHSSTESPHGKQPSIESAHGRQSSTLSPHGRQSSTKSSHERQSSPKSSFGKQSSKESSHGKRSCTKAPQSSTEELCKRQCSTESPNGRQSSIESLHERQSSPKSSFGRHSSMESPHGKQSSMESSHGRQSSTESPHGRQSSIESSHGKQSCTKAPQSSTEELCKRQCSTVISNAEKSSTKSSSSHKTGLMMTNSLPSAISEENSLSKESLHEIIPELQQDYASLSAFHSTSPSAKINPESKTETKPKSCEGTAYYNRRSTSCKGVKPKGRDEEGNIIYASPSSSQVSMVVGVFFDDAALSNVNIPDVHTSSNNSPNEEAGSLITSAGTITTSGISKGAESLATSDVTKVSINSECRYLDVLNLLKLDEAYAWKIIKVAIVGAIFFKIARECNHMIVPVANYEPQLFKF